MESPGQVESSGIVLLAEDDPSVRAFTSSALENRGFTVLSACNAKEALTVFEEYSERLCLLVTDVHMGDGPNGVELAQQILGRRRDLPVLVYSGTPDAERMATAAQLPFLAKPFSVPQLYEHVDQVMESARGTRGRTAGGGD